MEGIYPMKGIYSEHYVQWDPKINVTAVRDRCIKNSKSKASGIRGKLIFIILPFHVEKTSSSRQVMQPLLMLWAIAMALLQFWT